MKVCLDIAGTMITTQFSLFRAAELSVQWQVVLEQGHVGP